jgi:hypothetical protein
MAYGRTVLVCTLILGTVLVPEIQPAHSASGRGLGAVGGPAHAAGEVGPGAVGGPAKKFAGVVLGKPILKSR